jgi:peptidyl-prolyl cis-trans isomerase D
MAIVNKIREKAGIAVGFIAVSMILFIVGGDLLSPNSKLLGSKKNIVGVIDGNEIGLEEYARKVEELTANYRVRLGRTPNDFEMDYIRQEAWNAIVTDLIMTKQYEKLGIMVTKEEIVDMLQGNNIHPQLAAEFKDEQGNIDKNRLKQFFANFKNLPLESQIQVRAFKDQLPTERLRQKYEKLLSYSTYVTKLEAENEYHNRYNKVDVKYLYVPFNSIADSTIRVTDSQVKEYFDKHKSKYTNEDNRGIEYVTFSFKASANDSAAIKKELEDLMPKFKEFQDDTTFVQANSDDNTTTVRSYRMNELPKELQSVEAAKLVKGEVFGVFLSEGRYKIHKVVGTKDDTVFSARASHILFETRGKSGAEKAEQKKKATDVLERIKKNPSEFEAMAAIYGSDGTKNSGGDLNWFKEGQMVKPFNDAVMNATAKGLLPTLVETEFGYHILKVTETKTKKQIQIATVAKDIVPSAATREKAYAEAANFAKATNPDEYFNNVKATKGLLSLQALTIPPDAKYINNLSGAKVREVVRWAYNEGTALGMISPVFELDDMYIVAMLRDKKDKGEAKLEDVKQLITAKVREEMKAQQIIDKLKGLNGTLEEIAQKYGQGATVLTHEDLNMNSLSLTGVGSANQTIGKANALTKGAKTAPYKDDNGVLILEIVNVEEAQKVADHTVYKSELEKQRENMSKYNFLKAIKKLTKTEDYIAKFY